MADHWIVDAAEQIGGGRRCVQLAVFGVACGQGVEFLGPNVDVHPGATHVEEELQVVRNQSLQRVGVAI